jgi:hypothetical protein
MMQASKQLCALRRYAPGDLSVAESCDTFCTGCGQGHTHFLPCNKALCDSNHRDGVRHNTDRRFGACTDEYTHDFYWEAINIEDPCKDASEQKAFALCGKFCPSEEHQQVQSLHAVEAVCIEPC